MRHPVLAPRSAIELLPSRVPSSAWPAIPRGHSSGVRKQVIAKLDLPNRRATLRKRPDFPERPAPDFTEHTETRFARRARAGLTPGADAPHAYNVQPTSRQRAHVGLATRP